VKRLYEIFGGLVFFCSGLYLPVWFWLDFDTMVFDSIGDIFIIIFSIFLFFILLGVGFLLLKGDN